MLCWLCSTAKSIWNAYLGGSGVNRPFGTVVLDGVDLDVEAPTGKQYYADFVKALKGELINQFGHQDSMHVKPAPHEPGSCLAHDEATGLP